MPQPDEVTRRADAYIRLLDASEERIIEQQARILDPVLEGRKAARLQELRNTVAEERAAVISGTRDWLDENIDAIYEAGPTLTGIGKGFVWTQFHREAADAIADFHYEEILAATGNMDATAKTWFRDVARLGNERSVTEGITRQQQAREIRRAAASSGLLGPDGQPLALAPVVYRNGARHSLSEYSGMLARTTTAVTYNTGSLNQMQQLGIGWVEAFDGADCGATSHDDADKVNGTIRTVKWAQMNMIAHPNAICAGTRFLPIGAPTQVARARYSGPAVEVRTAEDHWFRVTPNHPIATRSGWVRAGNLKPGDEVLGDGKYRRAGREVIPNPDFVEAPFVEDAFSSLLGVGAHRIVVPAADDLHGAAVFCDPEVDVVDLDDVLWVEAKPLHPQRFGKGVLVLGDSETPLMSRDGTRPLRILTVDLPATGSVGVPDESGTASGVEGGPSGAHCFGSGRHLFTPVRVVSARAVWFEGDVFDATTEGACYLAGGIVVANCRRSFGARPDIESDEDAETATPFLDPAVAARQAEAERLEYEAKDTRRRGRTSRTSRTERTTRTPRSDVRKPTPKPTPKPQAPRPGDRFRATGDWREGLADDFDIVHTRTTTLRPSEDKLADDALREITAAQRRMGSTINQEVERRRKFGNHPGHRIGAIRKEVLQDLGVEFVDPSTWKVRGLTKGRMGKSLPAADVFDDALSYFPRRWADAIDETMDIGVRTNTKGRAFYQGGFGPRPQTTVSIEPNNSAAVILHEFTHAAEDAQYKRWMAAKGWGGVSGQDVPASFTSWTELLDRWDGGPDVQALMGPGHGKWSIPMQDDLVELPFSTASNREWYLPLPGRQDKYGSKVYTMLNDGAQFAGGGTHLEYTTMGMQDYFFPSVWDFVPDARMDDHIAGLIFTTGYG